VDNLYTDILKERKTSPIEVKIATYGKGSCSSRAD
jgi:hypothetical protein